MANKNDVTELLYQAIDDVNLMLPRDRRIDKRPETVLSGSLAVLDSLAMVNLIVAAEQKIEERFGRSITLVDEKSMSKAGNPFRTVDSLAEYTAALLSEKGDA